MQKEKILSARKNSHSIIIGPTSPHRGGIAKYTERLAVAMSEKVSIEVVSFSKLYPKFLYPGQSSEEEKNEIGVKVSYSLSSNNPISWGKTARYIIGSKPDTLFITWWTLFWQPMLWFVAAHAKRKNIQVVYICHNVYDHQDSGWMKYVTMFARPFTRFFLRVADGYLVQSSEQETLLRSIVGREKNIVVRQHPVYDSFPKPTVKKPKPQEKRKLQLLFIGFIRAYKGLDTLLDAYGLMSDSEKKQIKLMVVGETWGDRDELIEKLDGLGIAHEIRYVDDQEMVNYIANSDAVVLPYKAATGSGIIPVSYFCSTPVIATNVGGLREVVESGKTGWLVEPNNPEELANVMKTISSKECASMQNDIARWVKRNSWSEMANALTKTFIR